MTQTRYSAGSDAPCSTVSAHSRLLPPSAVPPARAPPAGSNTLFTPCSHLCDASPHFHPQGGSARLPDLYVSDKNDTFHLGGQTYGSFRLMARAVRRDAYGNTVVLPHVAPALSQKFVVSAFCHLERDLAHQPAACPCTLLCLMLHSHLSTVIFLSLLVPLKLLIHCPQRSASLNSTSLQHAPHPIRLPCCQTVSWLVDNLPMMSNHDQPRPPARHTFARSRRSAR